MSFVAMAGSLRGIHRKTTTSTHSPPGALLKHSWNFAGQHREYFGLLAEFGEANIPLERVAPKYLGLSNAEARRRAPAKQLPCLAFRLGGQESPWLVSATDLAELIDVRRQKAG